MRIKETIPNTQARAFISMFILEIDQFILTPLTIAALDAEDGETAKDRLVFSITEYPLEWYITHLEDHTKAITSFIRQDLYHMKITYQPPNITHSERQNYEVRHGPGLLLVRITVPASTASLPVAKCCIHLSWSVCFSRLSFKQLLVPS